MGKCKRCGRKGLFLKLTDGVCENCVSVVAAEADLRKIQESKEAIQKELTDVSEQLREREITFSRLEKEAKKSALKKAGEELASLNSEVAKLSAEISSKRHELGEISKDLIETREEIMLQSFGLYQPRYSFMVSDEYKSRLLEIRAKQKDMLKNKIAATGATSWTVNGSATQGKKMVADTQKLLLRAFNAECDDVVEHVKYNNIEQSEKRITASRDAISKLVFCKF